MTRALLFVVFASVLPPACEKLLPKNHPEPTTVDPTVEPAPPPPPSETTPPVWSPPPDPATLAAASAAAPPPPGPELAKAQAAASHKDWKKVKALLDHRVRSGKGTPEEAQLLLEACTNTKDKACVDAVNAKFPQP
jgi:hypothetical protein